MHKAVFTTFETFAIIRWDKQIYETSQVFFLWNNNVIETYIRAIDNFQIVFHFKLFFMCLSESWSKMRDRTASSISFQKLFLKDLCCQSLKHRNSKMHFKKRAPMGRIFELSTLCAMTSPRRLLAKVKNS